MPSGKYMLQVAERNEINVASFFLTVSRNYIPPMPKYIVAVFHANAAMCFPWAYLSMHKELGLNH